MPMNNLRSLPFALCLIALVACFYPISATTADSSSDQRELFKGQTVPPPNDRLHTNSERKLTITTAVPSAEETKAIFGKNPMPKTFTSRSPFAGSNGTFIENNRGTLGIRYWNI